MKINELGWKPVDAGNTEVREMIHEDDEEFEDDDLAGTEDVDAIVPDEEEVETEVEPDGDADDNQISFAPPAQSLGMIGGALGTTTTAGIDVNVDANSKTVNIKMNESAGKYPNGHVPAKKSSIATKPVEITKTKPTTNLKGVEVTPKKLEGRVLATKSSIADKAAPMTKTVPSTNLKGVEPVAKKTEGHVMTKKATIATKPVKTEMIKEEDEPSKGLNKAEKSDIVKKAKSGEDLGKKGKGFEKVADKAAKEYGSKEKGEKVAAAAMWKNAAKAKNESVEISEAEQKLRSYIRRRLEEKTGKRKAILNESAKSEKLKQLDEMIDKQFAAFHKK